MSTRNLAPRASGEGGIGTPSLPWASGEFINLNALFVRRKVYANAQAAGNFSLPFNSGELQTIVVTGTNIHTLPLAKNWKSEYTPGLQHP